MNITLVFPPAADPSLPYSSLAVLGAVLKRAGYQDVALYDLNLAAFDDLLQPDVLKKSVEQCHSLLKTFGAGDDRGVARKVMSTLATADEVIKNITSARHILRDSKDFYEPQQLLFAKRIFHLGGALLSAPYPNIQFGKYSYSASSYDSFEEIERAIHADEGPLIDYFRTVAVPTMLARSPRVIGISVPYFSQLIPAFTLAAAIRQADPAIHITMGGPVITWGKDVLIDDPRFARWIDSFFLGEAEQTFLEFVEALDGKRSFEQLRNIARYVNGRVVDQFDPTYQLDLDWPPAPDFTLLPLQRYFAPKRVICMTLTRGCYYNKCTFCNYAFIKLAPYRLRSPELIASDIATITQATGEDVFCFESDVILPRHLRLIANAIIETGVQIKWHGVARFERGMTEELFQAMRRSGCVRLYMGLESANPRVLKAMDKGTTPDRMTDILKLCHSAGISVEAGVFSNFPSETVEEAEDTYRFIREHRHVLTRADVGSFRLLKGAPVTEHPEHYQITLLDDPAKRWYHLNFSDPTPRTLHAGALSAMEKIQQLYPEVVLIDVPEDILYIAEKGPNVFGKLFGWVDRDDAARPIAIPDDCLIAMAPSFEIHAVRVTNAGAVYFDNAEDEVVVTRPLFEWSQTEITIALDHRSLHLHPLTPVEALIMRKLKRCDRRYGDVRDEVLQKFAGGSGEPGQVEMISEWYRAINRLSDMGVLQIEIQA